MKENKQEASSSTSLVQVLLAKAVGAEITQTVGIPHACSQYTALRRPLARRWDYSQNMPGRQSSQSQP